MNSMPSPERYAPGTPEAVELEQVETHLRWLWEQTALATEGEPAPMLQVRTLNLVVHVSGVPELERLRAPLAEISAAHPGRVMMLCPSPSAPEGRIGAQATIYCYLARPGRQHICGEEITLTAQGAALQQLHTAVLSLLLSDLPVILWWTHEPPLDEPRFAALAATADRLILDSATFRQPLAQLRSSAAFSKQRQQELALSDLNWTRLTSWRELVAQLYDDRAALAYLSDIEQMTLTYGPAEAGGEEPGLLQALLLAGWLSSRLGWQPHAGARQAAGASVEFSAGQRTVMLQLAQSTAGTGAGLQQLQLSGAGASLSITREPGAAMARLTAQLPGRETVTSCTRLLDQSLASLMRQELMISRHDQVYEQALHAAGQLADMLD